MADLGAVGKRPARHLKKVLTHDYMGIGTLSTTFLTMPRQDGTLGGVVTEGGVPVPNCEVMVMWRPHMRLIARARTASDGSWSVSGLDPTKTSEYAIVIKDPPGGTAYNDGYYALVVPA
jgi:hypothetical protein